MASWRTRSQGSCKTKKNIICSLFYNQLRLVVDQTKQGGGNSNDGNTVQKVFDNPDLVSQLD